MVILSQTLATQITRQLPQYATLKAMGYCNSYLGGIVVTLATMMSTISFVPAIALATFIYWIVQCATSLPIHMTLTRLIVVLTMAWAMSALSALVSLRILRRADPVELF
jgi:putative ABC transport system permease protein